MRLLRFFSLLLVTSMAFCQATFGTLTGTVTDSTGAVIPNASLEIVNEGTNIARKVTSDSAGNYELTHLIAGAYRVTAKAGGFKTFILRGIAVESLRTVRIDL